MAEVWVWGRLKSTGFANEIHMGYDRRSALQVTEGTKQKEALPSVEMEKAQAVGWKNRDVSLGYFESAVHSDGDVA